ncbi:hypothetical protein NL676_038005 [Syzygium grande]|nr:hypothetical protein NL676_038005 [Syzygium grande]
MYVAGSRERPLLSERPRSCLSGRVCRAKHEKRRVAGTHGGGRGRLNRVSDDNAERKNGSVPESIMTPNWTINVSEGATIADLCVSITPVDDYQLPPEALPSTPEKKPTIGGDAIRKAEDVVSSMLAAGFVLGKDAIARAKSLDEQHRWTSSASAAVASIGGKINLGERLGAGTAMVAGKAKEMDERFHVSEMTRSALAIAEQIKAGGSTAGSGIMSNRYVSTGASWVSSALGTAVKVAEDVRSMTKEKVEKAEQDKTVISGQGEVGKGNDAADGAAATQVHVEGSSGGAPVVPLDSKDAKLGII